MTTKYVDVLDQDEPIPGQKFACISFLSPEEMIKQKEIFLYEEFLKHLDVNIAMKKFESFLNFVSYKYNISFSKIINDFNDYVASEKDVIKKTNVQEQYKTFLEQNGDKLQDVFNEKYKFQTNTRGIKIRGSYETQKEAEMKCHQLRKKDPNHDIFVGLVGVWMPWDPDAYKTGKVEYLEQELNDLMHEKLQNQNVAKRDFEKRVKEMKQNAIEENKANAKKYDIKLTQNIKKDGTLFKTNESPMTTFKNTQENKLDENLKNELFENE